MIKQYRDIFSNISEGTAFLLQGVYPYTVHSALLIFVHSDAYSWIEEGTFSTLWRATVSAPWRGLSKKETIACRLQTDHNQVRDKSRKQLRWSITLQEYDMKVEHKSGKQNCNVDALSRA